MKVNDRELIDVIGQLYTGAGRGIYVAVDSSGSTAGCERTYRSIIRRIHNAFGHAGFRILFGDTEITQNIFVPQNSRLPEYYFPFDAGGTDYNAPLKLAQQRDPGLLVYLTDGFAEVPRIPVSCPVLWVLVENYGENEKVDHLTAIGHVVRYSPTVNLFSCGNFPD